MLANARLPPSSSLRTVVVTNCLLQSPAGARALATFVSALANVRSLEMWGNELSARAHDAFLLALDDAAAGNLRRLEVGYHRQTYTFYESFPDAATSGRMVAQILTRLPNLQVLDVYGLTLGPVGLDAVARFAGEVPNLRKLRFAWCEALHTTKAGQQLAVNLAKVTPCLERLSFHESAWAATLRGMASMFHGFTPVRLNRLLTIDVDCLEGQTFTRGRLVGVTEQPHLIEQLRAGCPKLEQIGSDTFSYAHSVSDGEKSETESEDD
eukprot:gnl/TRDRNA2_/TRDRNA2_157868_c0_seq1.p1 gnl/TRDRNA2_/TRDRNA2_157868_c0~~gnl/TRDRNA2_/TRDRNA2_157868_c0_seq1.p1  ORF type:complete len:296 (-),score=49.87 gnl/TRDRNA2_/TRDRNA2_157868_c0_seq1:103-903(-)